VTRRYLEQSTELRLDFYVPPNLYSLLPLIILRSGEFKSYLTFHRPFEHLREKVLNIYIYILVHDMFT